MQSVGIKFLNGIEEIYHLLAAITKSVFNYGGSEGHVRNLVNEPKLLQEVGQLLVGRATIVPRDLLEVVRDKNLAAHVRAKALLELNDSKLAVEVFKFESTVGLFEFSCHPLVEAAISLIRDNELLKTIALGTNENWAVWAVKQISDIPTLFEIAGKEESTQQGEDGDRARIVAICRVPEEMLERLINEKLVNQQRRYLEVALQRINDRNTVVRLSLSTDQRTRERASHWLSFRVNWGSPR